MRGLKPKKSRRGLMLKRLILVSIIFLSIGTHVSSDENSNTHSEKFTDSSASHLAEAGKFKIGDDPTVWILILLFNVALAVTLERIWVMWKNKGRNDELMDKLTRDLTNNSKIKDLLNTLKNAKFGMEGRIAYKTLQGWNFGDRAMKEFAGAAMESERRLLEKRLGILSTLGNNAPFIGLLGTVLGIMKAFRDLALMGDAGPAVVMKGISEALIATAFGLGVAIPCVIAFNALSKKVRLKLSNAEEVVSVISGIRVAVDNSVNGSGSLQDIDLAMKKSENEPKGQPKETEFSGKFAEEGTN